MGRLAAADRWLLLGLLSVWMVCLGLHVREIVRSGFAEPPIYAAPSPAADGYPTLGGFRLERGRGG